MSSIRADFSWRNTRQGNAECERSEDVQTFSRRGADPSKRRGGSLRAYRHPHARSETMNGPNEVQSPKGTIRSKRDSVGAGMLCSCIHPSGAFFLVAPQRALKYVKRFLSPFPIYSKTDGSGQRLILPSSRLGEELGLACSRQLRMGRFKGSDGLETGSLPVSSWVFSKSQMMRRVVEGEGPTTKLAHASHLRHGCGVR